MPIFKITLAYDGTGLVGWQRQAAGVSVQGLLEDALRELANGDVAVAGAGRTDAGVHALGQVASFSLDMSIGCDAVMRALNTKLPGAVRVVAAAEMPPGFHARFGARSKTYRYRIWNGPLVPPFERLYAWHVIGDLDVERMTAAARLLEGTRDFAAFQAAGGSTTTTVRTITSSRIVESRLSTTEDMEDTEDLTIQVGLSPRVPCDLLGGALIVYEVRGNGFLRYMVRNIVGTIVEIGRGRQPVEWMHEVLASRNRARAGVTAPAEGLFLVSVEYDERS